MFGLQPVLSSLLVKPGTQVPGLKFFTSTIFLIVRREQAFSLRTFVANNQHQRLKMAATSVADVTEVCEGKAKVALPASVFYNPVQEYNRDLTIAVISEFADTHHKDFLVNRNVRDRKNRFKNSFREQTFDLENVDNNKEGQIILEAGQKYEQGIRIFEGLAASGLRSVRFGLEIPGICEVVANDFDKTAVEFIQRNIEKNELQGLMTARCGDAAMGLYEHRTTDKQFDVIDLDPYGSPSHFLDATVQAVRDGGLLCITCTDAAVLCGNAPEKCHSNYGAISLRSKYCHEMGLRIILQCLDSHANRYSRYIVPLLSLSVDFYFRVFVQVYTSQKQVKHSCAKKAMVYECTGCGAYTLQPLAQAIPTKGEGNFKFVAGHGPVVPQLCQHCGHQHRMGGPIWSAPLHDQNFISRVIDRVRSGDQQFATADRITGMLNVAKEELLDVPLYYKLDSVCGVLHCCPPSMIKFRSALLNAAYKVSLSHALKNSYKTDAPASFIWDIMRTWVKDNPVNEKWLTPGSVAKTILDQPAAREVSFTEHPDANPHSREQGLLRWQVNPTPNWGPKAKAKRSHEVDLPAKQTANQGKTKKSKAVSSDLNSNEEEQQHQMEQE